MSAIETDNQIFVAADSGNVFITATGATITALQGDQIILTGGSNTLIMANGDAVSIVSGTSNKIELTGGAINVGASVSNTTLIGNGSWVDALGGDQIDVSGYYDGLEMVSGDSVNILSGGYDIVSLSGGAINIQSNVTNTTLNGSGSWVDALSGDQVDVVGGYDGLVLANGDAATIGSGGDQIVSLSNGTIDLTSSANGLTFTGSGNQIGVADGITVAIGGSSDTIDISDDNISISGSENILNVSGTSAVSLMSGANIDLNMGAGGTLEIASGVNNISFNGTQDTIVANNNDTLNIWGGGNTINLGTGSYIGLQSGANNDVNMSGGTLEFGNSISSVVLSGDSNIVDGYQNDSISASGNGNTFNLGTGSDITIAAGANDDVYMNSSTLDLGNNISGAILSGMNDIINGTNNDILNIWGGGNTITLGTGSYIGLQSGANNDLNMNGGTLELGNSISSVVLFGDSNIVDGYQNDSMSASGNGNIFSLGTGSDIEIVSGTDNSVTMSSGTLYSDNGVTGTNLTGSNDVIIGGAGDQISVAGVNDTINVSEGGTVTLTAGDSGDTINMIGGTICLATGLTNITINGTGDLLTGPGAYDAGPVTTTTIEKAGPGGSLTPITTTSVPPVIYDAGNIQDLVTYFGANLNLSQAEIQAAESDPTYAANLNNFLNGAILYGSPNALPSNVLAMLDGYSSIYLALSGVPAQKLSETAYIEQQFAWVTTNYPIPTDFLSADMKNLMPAIESTNARTQSLVSEALTLLEQGNAGAAGGNQTPMLDDTIAEMLLSIAETPGFSPKASLGDEVHTPGQSGHWQIVVNADGAYSQTFKSPPLIQTVLSDFDTYVAPIIDLVALLCLNPEFIAITSLAPAIVSGVEIASSAVNLVQAGQNIAEGHDLQGALEVIAAVGSVLQDVGAAAQSADFAAGSEVVGNSSITDLALGQALSDSAAIAQGIDGLVSGNATVLDDLTNALGAVGGAAGLARDTTVQEFAALGSGLASTVQNGESGNILAALTSLVQSSTGYEQLGGISGIGQDADALYFGLTEALNAVGSPGQTDYYTGHSYNALTEVPTKLGQQWATGEPWVSGDWTPIYNSNNQVVGVNYLDPNNPNTNDAYADPAVNSVLSASADMIAQNDGVSGTPYTFLVVAHGDPIGLSSSDISGSPLISAQSVAATMTSLGVPANAVVNLLACNTANENNYEQYTPTSSQKMLVAYNGNAAGVNFAQTLANLTNNSVLAYKGYEVTDGRGHYIVDNYQDPSGQSAYITDGILNSDFNLAFSALTKTNENLGIGVFANVNDGKVELLSNNTINSYNIIVSGHQ